VTRMHGEGCTRKTEGCARKTEGRARKTEERGWVRGSAHKNPRGTRVGRGGGGAHMEGRHAQVTEGAHMSLRGGIKEPQGA
jgi:hypothetical protein